MKILITGGAGFIGSAVVRLAISKGHQVVNVDKLTYAANLTSTPQMQSCTLRLKAMLTVLSTDRATLCKPILLAHLIC